jgi:hypothetical protein
MANVPTFTLLCTLISGSIASEGMRDSAAEEPAQTRDQAAYERALAALDEAMIVANTDPEQGIVLLARALAALHQFAPRLATDHAARSRRSLAHLALARAELALGDEQGAEASIDAALRELGDVELPIDALGPTLAGRVEARRRTLAEQGEGRVHVTCSSPCKVWIDEHEADAALQPDGLVLPAGTHRVWLEDPEQAAIERRELEVRSHEVIEVRYPSDASVPVASVPAPALDDPRGRSERPPSTRVRLVPRWAELLGGGVGLVVLGGGSALWAIDSTCPGGASPSDIEACPSLYDTRTAGITSVALGSALLVGSIVLLALDERRERRASRRPHPLALRFGSP